jgi:hypothetical protein
VISWIGLDVDSANTKPAAVDAAQRARIVSEPFEMSQAVPATRAGHHKRFTPASVIAQGLRDGLRDPARGEAGRSRMAMD